MRSPAHFVSHGSPMLALASEHPYARALGGLVHNFHTMDWVAEFVAADPWAIEAESRVMARVEDRRWEELLTYRESWPDARRVAPTLEHFVPLFVALGAAHADEGPAAIFAGFQFRDMSLRSIAFGH